MQEACQLLSLHIPKIENIKKESKSIDDLLNWNREVSTLVSNVPNAIRVEIICDDFKIFNPLNDKLISNSTFS